MKVITKTQKVRYIEIDGVEVLLGDIIEVLEGLEGTESVMGPYIRGVSGDIKKILMGRGAMDETIRGLGYCRRENKRRALLKEILELEGPV